MKILVTGGSGFIGRHVVRELRRRSHHVIVLDRACTFTDGTERFYGDVKDAEAVMEAVGRSDGVIHLAGVLGTQETVQNPRSAVEVNIGGSLNVFHAVRFHNVPCVYIGVGNYWMNNPYSITKTTAERFAFMYNRECGTRIAVVRGLNVYGPEQKAKPVRKIVPNLILPALAGEPITIYGDGTQVMDMIYVEDIAEILVRALLKRHDCYDEVFQAGCGLDTTVNELAEMVLKLTGSSSKIRHVPMRPGETPNAVVKAHQEAWNLEKLDWTVANFTPLKEGLQKTIAWYLGEVEEEESTSGLSDPTVAYSTTGPGSEALL